MVCFFLLGDRALSGRGVLCVVWIGGAGFCPSLGGAGILWSHGETISASQTSEPNTIATIVPPLPAV
jgi:hypothetical protein